MFIWFQVKDIIKAAAPYLFLAVVAVDQVGAVTVGHWGHVWGAASGALAYHIVRKLRSKPNQRRFK